MLYEVITENIALYELGSAGHTGLFRVAPGEGDHVRVVLDAERTCAALRRGNDRATIARAEIDDVIARGDLGHVEHTLDQ